MHAWQVQNQLHRAQHSLNWHLLHMSQLLPTIQRGLGLSMRLWELTAVASAASSDTTRLAMPLWLKSVTCRRAQRGTMQYEVSALPCPAVLCSSLPCLTA